MLERVEGAAIAAAAVASYVHFGFAWGLFALLILSPDLSMVGYAGGPRLGARVYNFFHVYVWPAALIGAGVVIHNEMLLAIGIIWGTHIGIDRLCGFGLKYATAFKDTHLQHL